MSDKSKCPWCGAERINAIFSTWACGSCFVGDETIQSARCVDLERDQLPAKLKAAQARIAELEAENSALRSRLEENIPKSGPTHAPPSYAAEILEYDGELALSYGREGEGRRTVSMYGLPCLFMGVLAQRDETQLFLAAAEARCESFKSEISALRSRLGADDDDLPLSNEWLTATLGDAWRISVENGKLNIMDERPGDDEDEEQELAAWFQMVGRFDMVCVRPKIKTRGDVRRLLAALGEREGGE